MKMIKLQTITRLSRNHLNFGARSIHAENAIEGLGLVLPKPAVPKGNFVMTVRLGNLLYLSGHLPQPAEGGVVVGKVGKDLSVEEGLVSINHFSSLEYSIKV